MDPYKEANDAKVYAISASQRYAAALLLDNDKVHFKRRPSVLSSSDNSLETMTEGSIAILEGGYKPLDSSLALFKECEEFKSYHEKRITTAASTSAVSITNSCVTRQLRALEVYALSPANSKPPKDLKVLLKKLNVPESPDGARKVLIAMGHSSLGYKAITSSLIKTTPGRNKASSSDEKGSSSSYTINITPWSGDVINAAVSLKKYVENRRADIASSVEGRPGKRNPTGTHIQFIIIM